MLSKNDTKSENSIKAAFNVDLSKAVKVKYKNYRGEVALRSIIPIKVYWGQTEYHPHDQWLLEVWDVEKDAMRMYAFKDIQEFDVQEI